MKRIAFFLCPVISIFAVSCGHTISDSQTFKPNQPPVITDITFTLPAGVSADSLTDNTQIQITVTASDPEGKALTYSLSSNAGSVADVIPTATGCTAVLLTANVRQQQEVRLTASVADVKGARVIWADRKVGGARPNARTELILPEGSSDYIKPTGETALSFWSDSDGFYQIFCGDGQPLIDENNPGFIYTASGDTDSPNVKEISVIGNLSASNGKVRLSAKDDGVYTVGIAFRDNLKQYTYTYVKVNQDGTAPAITAFNPENGSTDIDPSAPIYVRFSEPISLDTSSILSSPMTVQDADDATVSGTLSVSEDRYRIEFSPGNAALKNLASYTVTLSSGPLTAAIRDRAGNEFNATQTAAFTTIEAGGLGKPVFTYGKDTFDFTDTNNTVSLSGPEGAAIHYTVAYGSNVPADPDAESATYSGEPISIIKNTTIKAIAIKEGYTPSAVSSVTLRRKTKTPSAEDLTRTSGTPYPSNGTIFHSTSSISFSKSSGTGYYLTSSTSDGSTPAAPSADPTTSDTITPTLSADNQRIIFKVRTQDTDMQMSDSYTSPVYRRRDLVRPNGTSGSAVSGYDTSFTAGQPLHGPNWTSVASSEDGRYLAATADNAGTYNKGGIFTSDDYGVTWTDHSGHPAFASTKLNWNKIVSSANGKYLAAADTTNGGIGDIWLSSNYGADWAKNTPDAQGNWLISMSDYGTLFAAKEGAQKSSFIELKNNGSWKDFTNTDNPIKTVLINPTDGVYYAFTQGSSNIFCEYNNGAAWTSSIITDMTSSPFLTCSNNAASFVAAGYAEDHQIRHCGQTFSDLYSSNTSVTSINTPWSGLCISDNGCYITAIDSNIGANPAIKGSIHRNKQTLNFSDWDDNIFTSEGTDFWTGIASDNTGSMLAATAYGSSIWCGLGTVTNQGDSIESWTWAWYNQNMRNWSSIACSADGQYVLACDKGYGHGGYIYRSEDWGSSWSIVKTFSGGSSFQRPWKKVAISKDGLFAAAIAGNEMFYSNNGGKDWNRYSLNCAAGVELGDVSVSGISGVNAIAAAFTSGQNPDRYYVCSTNATPLVNGDDIYPIHYGIMVSNDATRVYFTSTASYPLYYATKNDSFKAPFTYPSAFNTGGTAASHLASNSDSSVIYYNSGDTIIRVNNLNGAANCGIPGRNILDLSVSSDGKCIWVLCQKDPSGNAGGIAFSADSGATWQMQTAVTSESWTCFAAAASFLGTDGIRPSVYLGAPGEQNISVLK